VSRGAARKEIEPRLAEATVAGMDPSSAAGLTLKSAPAHELTNTRVQANTGLMNHKELRRKSGPTFPFGLSVITSRSRSAVC
jgi:hypothetical protein